MTIDELRDLVWDDLFRLGASKSVDQIAMETNHSATEVRIAVSHEWFTVVGDTVSIAYVPQRAFS